MLEKYWGALEGSMSSMGVEGLEHPSTLVSEPSVETSAAARDGEVVTVTGQLVPRCILQHQAAMSGP